MENQEQKQQTPILFNKSCDLEVLLKDTLGYELYFKPWLYGHRTNWCQKTVNNLSYKVKMAFLYLVHCFFCCLGCGVNDNSEGYKIYDELMTIDNVLTLLLKTCQNIYNEPRSTQYCWLTNINNDDDPYLNVSTSRNILGQKKTIKVKSIRLVCGLFNKPVIIKNDMELQASHLCHKHTNCVNPWHLYPESDKINKSRHSCENGCANYCPHNPTCIWTNNKGKLLVHRNNINIAYSRSKCNCKVSCFQ